jgi:hypothetical protein
MFNKGSITFLPWSAVTLVPDVGVVEKSYDADANPVIEPLYALRCISVFTLALRVFISAAVRKLGIIFTLLFKKLYLIFPPGDFLYFVFLYLL